MLVVRPPLHGVRGMGASGWPGGQQGSGGLQRQPVSGGGQGGAPTDIPMSGPAPGWLGEVVGRAGTVWVRTAAVVCSAARRLSLALLRVLTGVFSFRVSTFFGGPGVSSVSQDVMEVLFIFMVVLSGIRRIAGLVPTKRH